MSSSASDTADTRTYQIVLNHEEQYSIWPVHEQIPLGWRAEGFQGSQDECLARIEQQWTDMRPLSLRRLMAAEHAGLEATLGLEPNVPTIVERLCALDEQPVRVSGAPFKHAIARGFLHLTFPVTGAELGIRLSAGSRREDIPALERGTLSLVGELELDFVPLRFSGAIDLATLEGTGKLERR
jgi:MbtH protein